MTKHEFMARLASELHKRNVADAADVIEEYEQHFAFNLADGYSEEEIAAKLLPLPACASPICLPGASSSGTRGAGSGTEVRTLCTV